MTNTRGAATRSAGPAATAWNRPGTTASTTVEHNDRPRHEYKITGGWVFPPDLSHELRYTSDLAGAEDDVSGHDWLVSRKGDERLVAVEGRAVEG